MLLFLHFIAYCHVIAGQHQNRFKTVSCTDRDQLPDQYICDLCSEAGMPLPGKSGLGRLTNTPYQYDCSPNTRFLLDLIVVAQAQAESGQVIARILC